MAKRRAGNLGGSGGVVAEAALGGVVAGAVDILAAAFINGVGIGAVLHAIALGLLGRSALSGGTRTAIIGLALQLAMGALIGAVYGLGCSRVAALRSRWLAGGLAYGVIVFLVMNWAVMPLSRVGHAPRFTPLSFALNLAAMLLFGVIVAYSVQGRSGR